MTDEGKTRETCSWFMEVRGNHRWGIHMTIYIVAYQSKQIPQSSMHVLACGEFDQFSVPKYMNVERAAICLPVTPLKTSPPRSLKSPGQVDSRSKIVYYDSNYCKRYSTLVPVEPAKVSFFSVLDFHNVKGVLCSSDIEI